MIINAIELTNFRNYAGAAVSFDPAANIVTGRNGQGKTNLLEAIYLMSLGKSFRTLKDEEMIRFGEDFFRIAGSFTKGGEALAVEIRESRREKKFILDGAEHRRYADLAGHVYTVIFSPEDLRIVKENPDKRRKFMDRELFFLKPLYYVELVRYRKALRNRNAVLREPNPNEDLLSIYEEQLAESGARVMRERAAFTEKLDARARETQENITSGAERLTVAYDAGVGFVADEQEQARLIREALAQSREKDIRNRITSTGPHKDDLKICANGIDLRKYGSQGQHRTAALSLKLAELSLIKEETGEDAILLLDDVLSELDEDRQKQLISSFESNQLFISTAELTDNLLRHLPAGKTHCVSEGRIV
ncbi:MAG: DNA replication/repair protein RecF [Clostridiales Family XIII bacterium]|jgi:DNA replication and repair protein RecF|nr:DNA replication/repair protein RecF [Clostridiales Family XIII bacterium]